MVTLTVLIPAASSAGTYDYWQKIDKNGEQDVSMLDSVLGVLNSSVKIEMLVFLLGITGFLALRSPLTLLIVPTLGWRLLSQDSNHWGMVWHYSAILMPVLFLALVDGVRRSRGSHRPWLASYAEVVVPVAAAIAVAMTQHLPLRDLLRPETYRTDDVRSQAARAALDAIPPGSRVETDITLMAHLTSDRTVYWVGGAPGTAPDIVAVNLDFGWSRPIEDPVAYAEQLHPEARYRLKHRVSSFVVMERTTAHAGPVPLTRPPGTARGAGFLRPLVVVRTRTVRPAVTSYFLMTSVLRRRGRASPGACRSCRRTATGRPGWPRCSRGRRRRSG